MPDSFNELGAMLAAFLPNLLIALAILIVGWLVALAISKLVENLLHRTTLDDRIAGALRGGQPDRIPAERWIALVVFWLIMLFVIMVFLNTLDLGAVSQPLNRLLTNVVEFIPNLLAAAVLLLVAWLIGTVLRLLITRVLNASRVSQRLSENAQVDSRSRITVGQTIGNIVFWLVLLLFLPAILDALQLQGILAPVQDMVDNILGSLPNIFAAFIVLAVAYLVARLLSALVSSILTGIGFDRLFSPGGPIPVSGVAATTRTATYPVDTEPDVTTRRPTTTAPEEGVVQPARLTPSEIVGRIVMVAILLFAAMEAADLLGFDGLTALIGQFIVAAWNILVGLIIFGLGLWLSNLAYRMIRDTGTVNADVLATVARVAILIFTGALALRQMGIAESIVNLAFGLLFGAVAVAAALAFGLGGRNFAGELLERWRNQIRSQANRPSPSIPATGRDRIDPTTGQDLSNLPPDRDIPTPPAGEPDI